LKCKQEGDGAQMGGKKPVSEKYYLYVTFYLFWKPQTVELLPLPNPVSFSIFPAGWSQLTVRDQSQ